MDSLQTTDTLGGRGATHPRVSLKDINDSIAAEHSFTAAQAIVALGQPLTGTPVEDDDGKVVAINSPLDLLTMVILVMRNGFVVIGKSAPASPENFDEAKGRTFAREDAIRQLWPLMGFSLRDRLHSDAEDARLLAMPYNDAAKLRTEARLGGDAATLARLDRLKIAVDA